jgi:hypothetical protein
VAVPDTLARDGGVANDAAKWLVLGKLPAREPLHMRVNHLPPLHAITSRLVYLRWKTMVIGLCSSCLTTLTVMVPSAVRAYLSTVTRRIARLCSSLSGHRDPTWSSPLAFCPCESRHLFSLAVRNLQDAVMSRSRSLIVTVPV